MAKVEKNEEREIIEIPALEVRSMTFNILGLTPLILNRQSEKAKRQLLLPSKKMNQAERDQTLKHNPYEEFRASAYINRDENTPTYLHVPGGFFKRSTASAALDIPGARKAQVGRLVSLTTTTVFVWGIPHLKSDMVRQAGIAKTPDCRFRTCIPEWATQITMSFIPAIISATSLVNLVAAAGVIVGCGDYRVEKGAGDFGKWCIVDDDDPTWLRIMAEGGREAQIAAMDNPIFYDQETQDLVKWFDEEVDRRRRTPTVVSLASKNGKAAKGKSTNEDAIQ
ncbi:MAG TPA: hypothetical protein VK602_15060 [Phyllobacterium sp.]|nr:hypothetical protein [Phyllobacterium sp.]